MANNTLRMSGLNSGLDTEAIVNALTAATKNKINTNQRKVLKLQAQQEAYRTIIDKFNAFKNKYFDILNIGTCLKSKTMFNSFKSTLTGSNGESYVPGVTVTSNTNANTGSYNVTVNKVATQTTYKSSNDTGKALDLDSLELEPDRDYAMKVTVGNKTKYISFTAGSSDSETINNINDALKEAFGSTNSGKGIVYLDEETMKFASTDKSAVVYTSPTLYDTERSVNLFDDIEMKNGSNSFDITVDGETKTVTFSTVTEDYFDDLFNGNYLKTEEDLANEFDLEDEEQLATYNDLMSRLALYKEVVLNQREGDLYKSFDEWYNGIYNETTESWDFGATDAEKKDFADWIAQTYYEKGKEDLENDYNNAVEAKMKLKAYAEYEKEYAENLKNLGDGEEPPEKLSFDDFINERYVDPTDAEKEQFVEEDKDGIALKEQYEKKLENLEKTYQGYTEKAKQKEISNSYNDYFQQAKEAAKQAAYDEAVSEGKISNSEGDENYVAFEDFKDFTFTKADFEAVDDNGDPVNSFYEKHLQEKEAIETAYDDEDYHTIDLTSLSKSQLVAYYDEYKSADEKGVADKDDYVNNYELYMSDEAKAAGMTAAQEAVYQFNKANIENNMDGLYFKGSSTNINATYERDGTLTITGEKIGDYTVNDDGEIEWETEPARFAITANANSKNDFGFDATDTTGTASQISTASTLAELGIEPDDNGNYTFSINGVNFSFSGDTTISDMMKKVNASTAGVKMSYTTLTNQFIITSNEYGTGGKVELEDGREEDGLLATLGFKFGDDAEDYYKQGENTELEINGELVETSSNSYTIDGTTFTFTQAAVGQSFTNEVSRDYSKAIDTIKGFVEDYNKLIEDIYGYVDDEPNNDYYFLTDDDIDDMDLSETQQAKWEKLAKKGLLYRDSTLTDIMSKLRTVLYNSVEAADGTKVGLYTLGITTSSDYTNHGKLVIDDTVDFEGLFEKYADEITTLFTDKDKGIATQFENIINNATRTTGSAGERGSLVDKAGVSGTSSATSNSIYNQIQSLQNVIASLQRRYEQQQDRFWKIYGNMETMLGNLNSQTSYINQLLGSY